MYNAYMLTYPYIYHNDAALLAVLNKDKGITRYWISMTITSLYVAILYCYENDYFVKGMWLNGNFPIPYSDFNRNVHVHTYSTIRFSGKISIRKQRF